MLNPRSGIALIAVGSVIVIAGVAMNYFEIVGAIGMIIIGVAVEFWGGITFWRHLKKNP